MKTQIFWKWDNFGGCLNNYLIAKYLSNAVSYAAVPTIKQKFGKLQPFAIMVGAMLHSIQDDRMFL